MTGGFSRTSPSVRFLQGPSGHARIGLPIVQRAFPGESSSGLSGFREGGVAPQVLGRRRERGRHYVIFVEAWRGIALRVAI